MSYFEIELIGAAGSVTGLVVSRKEWDSLKSGGSTFRVNAIASLVELPAGVFGWIRHIATGEILHGSIVCAKSREKGWIMSYGIEEVMTFKAG